MLAPLHGVSDAAVFEQPLIPIHILRDLLPMRFLWGRQWLLHPSLPDKEYLNDGHENRSPNAA